MGDPPRPPDLDEAQGEPPAQGPPPPPEEGAGEEPAPPPSTRSPGGAILCGATVSPGLVLGVVHRKDYDLARVRAERAPLDEVDSELNRFRKALKDSRQQLVDLKSRLRGYVPPDDARILDTHLTYLKDSVFIADVENLILNEQMRLEAAITKVIGDFDRIFRLVQSDTLRQSAVDLRDVGIRVLRNLESHAAVSGEVEPSPQDYVLVARELSIVDMFNLANEHVLGIATEEGAMTSHAAVFARSMRIPTLTGVVGLLDTVREGDFVILDATEGVLRVDPDDFVRQQYTRTSGEHEEAGPAPGAPDWATSGPRTADGEVLSISAACGNLPEVEQAAELGIEDVGLYRTELLYLVDKEPPSRDALVHHYASVVAEAAGTVTFRLLNADSGLDMGYLHPEREPNPQLGRVGIRALLEREGVLRRQLQALLLGGAGAPIRIAIPFVTDCGELRRLKEILFEERFELEKHHGRRRDPVEVGAVIETPAALLGIRDIAREAEFLVVHLDSLVQYLLAADRDNPSLASHFAILHPVVLRALSKISQVAEERRIELHVFGVTACDPENLPLLCGVGLRRFCVAPADLFDFVSRVASVDLRADVRAARAAAASSSPGETQSLVSGYRHGYAQS